MIKQIVSVFLAGALLAGCGSSHAPEETLIPEPLEPEETSQTAEPAEPSMQSDESQKPGPESDGSSSDHRIAEAFISTNDSFGEAYRPSIEFFSDGSFIMRENLYEGMGEYEGSYSFDGAYYECSVENINFSGFAGDDVKVFSFLKYDADTVILLDDLCGSRAKDVFTRGSVQNKPESSYDGSIRPVQEVGEITDRRVYTSASDMFSDPYRPELVLEPDGTFVLTENLFSGMGHYSGTYTAQDYNLTLHVEKIDFSGFAGDNVTEIRFEALSPDVLQLMSDLCGSQRFDTWYID